MMSASKGDWLYLGLSTFAAWILIQQERGKNSNLEILRGALRMVRKLERTLYRIDIAITTEIDKELDSYGA